MPQNPLWGLVGKFIGGPWGPLPLDPVSGALVTTTPAPTGPSNLVTNNISPAISATALGNGPLKNGVLIRAPVTNTGIVYVGAAGVTAVNGYPLNPGDYVSVNVTNLSQVYQFGTVPSTDYINYLGT